MIVPGANLLLSEQDLMSAESLVSSSKVVVCQLEISIGMSLMALKMAKKHNSKTPLLLLYISTEHQHHSQVTYAE